MTYNEEHIFQLILEKLSGEISEENLVYLNKAAAEDPNVKRCLDEMEDALAAAGPGFMNDVYNEMAWGRVLTILENDQALDSEAKNKPVPEEDAEIKIPFEQLGLTPPHAEKPVRRNTWWLAAAGLVMLLGAGLIFFLSGHKTELTPALASANIPAGGAIKLLLDNGDTIPLPDNTTEDIAAQEVKLHPVPGQLTFTANGQKGGATTLLVPMGKDYKVVLADGSKVHLNACSRLRFPFAFSGNNREVFLEGEAYFDIAPDAAHPFIVHTTPVAINVLGTSFNVNAYTDSLIVTSLVTGSVSTAGKNEAAVLLKPGMETVYMQGTHHLVRAFDENVTLAWRKGEYTYYNQSIASLNPVIQHWYGKTLVLEDKALGDKMLTGVIEREKPLPEFLDGLTKIAGVTYRITDDKVYLTIK